MARITVRGVKDKTAQCSATTVEEMQQLMRDNAVAHAVELCATIDTTPEIPQCSVELLQDNEECFAAPKGLPPHRQYDHKITLMPGVQPVTVKPYRYSSQQKDEIENKFPKC